MDVTDKSYNATMCNGYEDYQYRLDHSLANRMFLTCEAWCVYDIYKGADDAFLWYNVDKCYVPVTDSICHGGSNQDIMVDYVENVLCESLTPEPTEVPTCSPQLEWSEELMDSYCSVEDTYLTYKHYANISRAAVACEGYEDYESRLLKSLAQRMFVDCSAWCVYDYYSDAQMAWKWVNTDKCYKLLSWGACHWDYTNKVNLTEWEDAKASMEFFCTYSPTIAPTGCMPTYEWDLERAEELCPSNIDYGKANKTYAGAILCENGNFASTQENLEVSLANHFFVQCDSWCVYDYDTIINNLLTGSNDYGGYVWSATCWKPVTKWLCFDAALSEFEDITSYAEGQCDAQSL